MECVAQKPAGRPSWSQTRRTPLWVWAIIIVLACIPAVQYGWVLVSPPEGTVASGLPTFDSAFYLNHVNVFASDFRMPFATCKASLGEHNPAYFATPIFWPYSILGPIGKLLGIGDVLWLGVMNGLGGAFYLWAAYRFLKASLPALANRAWLFFAVGGGLGGLVYIATGLAGFHDAPWFETWFARFAMYELYEGPHLLPFRHFHRLYYTLPLGFGFLALAGLARSQQGVRRPLLVQLFLLQSLAAFINLRFGAFLSLVALIMVYGNHGSIEGLWQQPLRVFLAATVVGGAISYAIFKIHPSFSPNTAFLDATALWLSPFITSCFWMLLLAPFEVQRRIKALPAAARVATCAGVGYLLAFGLLFAGYQAYYGNIAVARDAAVALWASDKALVGAVIGAAAALFVRTSRRDTREYDWVVVWLVLFLAISISTGGHGRLLRYNPQRLAVLLPMPMSILFAAALTSLRAHRPAAAHALAGVTVLSGIASLSVGALFFQAPLGWPDIPYAEKHCEIITRGDETLLEQLEPGIVHAPKPMADIVALRPGMRVVYGQGSGEADQPLGELLPEAELFFRPEMTPEFRREFLDRWCADYVLCPDTWPVDPAVLAELEQMPGLRVVAKTEHGALFRRENP